MVAQGGGFAEPWVFVSNPKGSPEGTKESAAPPGPPVASSTIPQGSAELLAQETWATIGRCSAAANLI
jgi:hypothetical protein